MPSTSPQPMTRQVQLTELRRDTATIIDRVHRDKEHAIVRRRSLPVAVIIDIEEYEDLLDLHDPQARRDLEMATREYREGKARPAEDLLRELQAADEGEVFR